MNIIITTLVIVALAASCAVGQGSPGTATSQQALLACDPDCDSAAILMAWGMAMHFMDFPWEAVCGFEVGDDGDYPSSNLASCTNWFADGSGQDCTVSYHPATGHVNWAQCQKWGASE